MGIVEQGKPRLTQLVVLLWAVCAASEFCQHCAGAFERVHELIMVLGMSGKVSSVVEAGLASSGGKAEPDV